jgi:hypothetical protein
MGEITRPLSNRLAGRRLRQLRHLLAILPWGRTTHNLSPITTTQPFGPSQMQDLLEEGSGCAEGARG